MSIHELVGLVRKEHREQVEEEYKAFTKEKAKKSQTGKWVPCSGAQLCTLRFRLGGLFRVFVFVLHTHYATYK